MKGIPGQIIGEIGEIGRQIGGEITKIPTDIAGQAMESLGATSGKKTQGTTPQVKMTGSFDATKPKDAWDKFDSADAETKRVMARKALAELLKRPKGQAEESIWEKLQREEDQKKEAEDNEQKAQRAASLPQAASKRPRGDLYGTKAKKLGSEIGKNVKQD